MHHLSEKFVEVFKSNVALYIGSTQSELSSSTLNLPCVRTIIVTHNNVIESIYKKNNVIESSAERVIDNTSNVKLRVESQPNPASLSLNEELYEHIIYLIIRD